MSVLRRVRPELSWPYLFGLTVLVAIPAVWAVVLAFTDYTGLNDVRFTGLDNFSRLFSDHFFWEALGNSGVYVVISVPLRVAAALTLALLLYRQGTWNAAGRVAVYLPTIIPDIAYALLWAWLLNPFYGPFAAFAAETGLPTPEWLTDPWGARVSIAVMGGLQVGEGFLIALAWRRMIPARLYEAADVEGARPAYVLARVTLPLMAPVLALLALRDVLLALQLNFVPALIITDGGPRRATTYLPTYLYDHAFRHFRLGYASAVALTMLVTTGLILYVQYRLVRRWRLF